jgi:hypothetical protein
MPEREMTLTEYLATLPASHTAHKEHEKLKRIANALEELHRWCDERRNASEWTTLGMIQEKIREFIQK